MASISPTGWPDGFRRAVAQKDTYLAGQALIESGFRVLPVDDQKRPISQLTPHGIKDATDDPIVWNQWNAYWPNAGLGVVPGSRYIVIDDDSGALDVGSLGISGTWSEQTRRGFHYWAHLPPGRTASTAKLANSSGDLITGTSRYVVTSPTHPYEPIDLDAPILTLPEDSHLLTKVRSPRTIFIQPIPTPTEQHFARARWVISRLCTTREDIARDARKLLAGHIPDDATPSEADYRLALLASYWDQDPSTILAVLLQSGLKRKKWHRSDYLPRQIAAAIERRSELRAEALGPQCSFMGHPLPEAGPEQVSEILVWLISRHDDPSGFVRIPVGHVAAHCGVSRKTVQRHLARLESSGVIETTIEHQHNAGQVIKQRRARLAGAVRMLPVEQDLEPRSDDLDLQRGAQHSIQGVAA